jgi:hypothetical protein
MTRAHLNNTRVMRCVPESDDCKARGGRIAPLCNDEQHSRRAYLTATLRDGAILRHFGVARRLFRVTKPRGSRLELTQNRHRRTREYY